MLFDSKLVEKKIIEFIREIVKNSSSEGIVLGLSGGIDSALAAALCSKAIDPEKVNAVFFYESEAGKFEDNTDFKDASEIVKKTGIVFTTIDITPIMNGLSSTLKTVWMSETKKSEKNQNIFEQSQISLGNIKARIRMAILYNIANQTGSLVCGTKNKSEYLTGYFTKYGDGAVDFEPIADLYKTEVWELSKHLEIPKNIINKKPTAGFSPGQTDEDDLGMSYEKLDTILKKLENKKINEETNEETNKANKANEETLTEKEIEILKKIKSAEHKRKMPPICKIN